VVRSPSPCPVAGAAEGTGAVLFAAPGVDVPVDWMPVAGWLIEGADAAGAACPCIVPAIKGARQHAQIATRLGPRRKTVPNEVLLNESTISKSCPETCSSGKPCCESASSTCQYSLSDDFSNIYVCDPNSELTAQLPQIAMVILLLREWVEPPRPEALHAAVLRLVKNEELRLGLTLYALRHYASPSISANSSSSSSSSATCRHWSRRRSLCFQRPSVGAQMPP